MDVASGKIENLAGLPGFVFHKSVWMPDGHGLLVLYQDLSAGLNHNQIGFVSYPGGQLHAITKDTSNYITLTRSADAKTMATIQSKRLFTLYAIPAAGTGANPPNPGLPQQQKASLNFSWAEDDGFYLAEDNHLVRVSSDGSNKTSLASIGSNYSISACPDGPALLLSLVGQEGAAGTKIWRINIDGANLQRLSNGPRALNVLSTPSGRTTLTTSLAESNACRWMVGRQKSCRERRFPTP
jgi:hypothetical protein